MTSEFIVFSLKLLGRKDKFISYIQTMWKLASSSIIVNGIPSIPFPIETGVRQGDPIAGTLFIIAVETFANCIHNNKRITWASNKYNFKIVISLYCDDIILFLYGNIS